MSTANNAQEILRFNDVSFRYHSEDGETLAVDHLDFRVREGEFVAVIGPSGCGKTTVLSLAAGLIFPSEGNVEYRGKTFGYMLQKDELFPWRTIEQNLILPLEIKKAVTPEAKRHVRSLAEKYGLSGFLKSFPDQLSGGMRQRAALIRTLSADPELLLLDEPFSALDYQTRLNVCGDVARIIRSERKTAVLVTHDLSEAISLADRVIVLSCRPAHVKAEHLMNFSEEDPLARRKDPAFSIVFDTLWEELNE
ncbi:MAG: ABC transporter ATP-binding protein [Christensenellaceae bacterium]